MKRSLLVDASESGITAIQMRGRANLGAGMDRGKEAGAAARRWRKVAMEELGEYFAGRSRSFSACCDLSGLPAFTREVLRVTSRIPYGEVRSYRWVAEQLGKPKASRAVGNALARNPIPIIIPCHRVVRSDGHLGGYALGLKWKRKLLQLEKSAGATERQNAGRGAKRRLH